MAVEFYSRGYDTTTNAPYTEGAWADAHPSIGLATYGVRSPNHWKVTAVAGQDRTVSIHQGKGFGYGITDETYANETIQLDTIATGSRWDLIVCRRDWTPTAGVSKFEKINGGATAVIPGGRQESPGGIDDQPLALVQVTAGQTQPTSIIDLRTWSGDGGGIVAAHDLVRSFFNGTGTRLNINGVEWLRRSGANDTPEWVKLGEAGKIPLFGSLARGSAAPAGTQFLVQSGSTVIARETNGYGSIFFPAAFPNGIVSVQLTNGDIAATGRGFKPGVVSANTVAAHVEISNGSGVGYGSGAWRCDWTAIGW